MKSTDSKNKTGAKSMNESGHSTSKKAPALHQGLDDHREKTMKHMPDHVDSTEKRRRKQ